MSSDEKRASTNEKVVDAEKVDSLSESVEFDETLREPTAKDETLHRGLKARQISMIAVSLSLVSISTTP